MHHRQTRRRSRSTGRWRLLLSALTALATALVGVLVAAPPAQALSVCMDPDPPDWCYDQSPTIDMGDLASATRVPAGVSVAGWARHFGTTAYPTITITIGGTAVGTLVANQPTGTYGRAGFSGTVPASHTGQVCAQTDAGDSLGCAGAAVSQMPLGSFDGLSTFGGSMRLTGWAIDPDSAAPISVQVRQDGSLLGSYTAGVTRTDVGAAYPGYGDNHGFDLTLAQGADGTHSVCVYAVNTGYGSGTVQLGGCRSYTATHNPYGALEHVTRSGTSVAVSGWAVDPDQPTTPVSVTITTDGGSPTTVTANLDRQDVASAHPEAGAAHGYSTTIPANLAAGSHTVCATAVNLAWGGNVQLGCLSYTTPAPVSKPAFTPFTSFWPYLTGSASYLEGTSVGLAWTDSSTTTSTYMLERSDAGGPWHTVFSRMSGSMRYTSDDSVSPATAYCWRLTAVNDVSSAVSDPICGTTLMGYLPAPTNVTTTSTDSSITMSWTDNTDQETYYQVGISTTPYRLNGVTWVKVPAGSGTMSYTFTGLAPGTKYYVQPFALNPAYQAMIGGVAYGAYTSGPPVVGSFTTSPATIQACSPQAVTLSWQTTAATHVVVSLGTTVLADRTQASPDPWTDSVAAPKTDGNQTYKIVAYSPDGRSTTKSVTVGRYSAYPTIHGIMFSNTGWDPLSINSVDAYGNVLKTYATIKPGENTVVTLPNCQAQIIHVVDTSTGRVAWDSNGVILGYDQDATLSYGVS